VKEESTEDSNHNDNNLVGGNEGISSYFDGHRNLDIIRPYIWSVNKLENTMHSKSYSH